MSSGLTAKVEVKDFEKIAIQINGLGGKMREALLDEMEEGVNDIRNYIIQSIRNTATDPTRKYRRGKKWHQASKPGHPPAVDRGNMLASIRTHIKVGKETTFRVGSWLNRTKGDRYPAYLESGTRGSLGISSRRSGGHSLGGAVEARPWLEPALDVQWPKIKRRLSEITGQEIRRATRGVR